MNADYIIVQAGGKGTRLRPLTDNKPKSLVSVNNLPLVFHLFKKFPAKKFIIIGDYKFDVLARYLEQYAEVDYMLVHAQGEGNATGINTALTYIPNGTPLMIIWSDLMLADDFDIEALSDGCYVGTTEKFPCSWSFENGDLKKMPSTTNGVAGCFLFNNKQKLLGLPDNGSFTAYLQSSDLELKEFSLGSAVEVGTLESFAKVNSLENRCRPYNKITIDGEKVIKEGLTAEGKKLIDKEVVWYRELDRQNFKGIPQVYSLDPLTIERIYGDNIFRAQINDAAKKEVIDNLVLRLEQMHSLKKGEVNCFDMQQDYYAKTMKRLRSIESVIPFSNEKEIRINGRACTNVLRDPAYLQQKVNKILTTSEFGIIHGDCTLTNTLIDADNNIYFIDARGYFGHTELIGDVYYDWAKVYYSIEGAFDQFNVKNFSLHIGGSDVTYSIGASGWEHLTGYYLSKIPGCDTYRLKLIHAIIWLSLASHCWEDYDSLCTAFYNGLYLLNTLED